MGASNSREVCPFIGRLMDHPAAVFAVSGFRTGILFVPDFCPRFQTIFQLYYLPGGHAFRGQAEHNFITEEATPGEECCMEPYAMATTCHPAQR